MERVVILDRKGCETLLAVVKGTFQFSEGTTCIAENQIPITIADEYYGDPADSSLRIATDMLPTRPATGVTLTGHAVSPRGPVSKMPVGIKLGSLVQKAWVYGDRTGYQNIGRPAPFETMPLTWENAFGGVDMTHENEKHHDAQSENPIGKGFIAKRSERNPDETPLPNIEDPNNLIRGPGQRPGPVGFGPVAPVWKQRSRYAGTYDDAWVKQRAPLLPDDFDERFLQAAPGQLTADGYLEGNEEVEILGMTPEGRVRFSLEAHPPILGVRLVRKGIRSKPVLESIHFDTDQRHFTCTWKSAIEIQGKVEELINIEARIL
jgi:hypothetical protein